MIRLLLVDDDVSHLGALSRAFSSGVADLTVLTAGDANGAIAHLVDNRVDVLLTDLLMPGMSGFDLLAWVLTNKPHVPAFAMTANLNIDAKGRLAALGNVDCFQKPLDAPAVLERVRVAAKELRGHVTDFSLASFLQLVSMDRKTCTLTVEQDGRVGRLYLRKGELLDAQCGPDRGEVAAIKIAGWVSPHITISAHCSVTERVIHRPLGYIVMEAMRLSDEASLGAKSSPVPSLRSLEWEAAPAGIAAPETPRPSPQPPESEAPESEAPAPSRMVWGAPLPDPSLRSFEGATAIAVADDAGRIVSSESASRVDLSAWAILASKLIGYQRATLRYAGGEQSVEEIVLTTEGLCHLIRTLPPKLGGFVLIVFDPTGSSLMRRRLELDRFVAEAKAVKGNGG